MEKQTTGLQEMVEYRNEQKNPSWQHKSLRGSRNYLKRQAAIATKNMPAKVALVLGLCLSALAAIAVWQQERESLAIELQESSENFRAALQEQVDRNPDFAGGNFTAAELLKATLPGQVLEDLNIYLYEKTAEGKFQPLAFYEFNAHTLISDRLQEPKLSGRGWLCIGKGTEFRIDLPIRQTYKEKKPNSIEVAVA